MNEHPVIIRISEYRGDDYDKEIALRYEILRKPLGLNYTPEQLEAEADEIRFHAYVDTELAGCLLLKPLSAQLLQMRQVAVLEKFQGLGIGKKLVSACEEYAVTHNYTAIILHARKTVTDFYGRLGYTICSEEYTEVGIPHFSMRKELVKQYPADTKP